MWGVVKDREEWVTRIYWGDDSSYSSLSQSSCNNMQRVGISFVAEQRWMCTYIISCALFKYNSRRRGIFLMEKVKDSTVRDCEPKTVGNREDHVPHTMEAKAVCE